MNNILLNSQCKIINIVWIDRGIILTLIYYICKKYNDIYNKTIIINNKIYRKFLKYIFPQLKFKPYSNHNNNNFYFNIRQIIKNQDIIIDYINNYDEFINTKKIKFIPWYDMNDVLIAYEYNLNNKISIEPYLIFLNKFKCYRGNYISFKQNIYNQYNIWDLFIENQIFIKYQKYNYNKINIKYLLDEFINPKYTHINNKPKIYYVPVIQQSNPVINSQFINDNVKTIEYKQQPIINNDDKKTIDLLTQLIGNLSALSS